MLSRIAESLYWMNRYVERTDCILRMIRVNYIASLDKSHDVEFSWKHVLKTFSALADNAIEVLQYNTPATLNYLINDKTNVNSVINLITKARENARGVQDHITIELWECLNKYYLEVRNWQDNNLVYSTDFLQNLGSLSQNSFAFYGTSEVSMPRTEGWYYMNMGKFLERAIQTSNILDVKFLEFSQLGKSSLNQTYWQELLKSVSGFELYLKSYRTGVDSENVINMLIQNMNFPRSILYSINRFNQCHEKLRNHAHPEAHSLIQFKIGKSSSMVLYADLAEEVKNGLTQFLLSINDELYEAANEINKSYFGYN